MPGARLLLIEDDEVLGELILRNLEARGQEFRPLAYLPKPFLLDSLLRLAAEAESRKLGGAATGEEGTEHAHRAFPHEEDLYA